MLIPNSVITWIMAILLNAFLIYATYTDVKYMKITNKQNLIMLLTRLAFIPFFSLSTNLDSLFGAIVLSLCFFIPAMITCDAIGGDIKFAFNLGLWIGVKNALFVALIATVINFLYRFLFVEDKDKAPYVKHILGQYVPFKAAPKLALAPFFYFGYISMIIYEVISKI